MEINLINAEIELNFKLEHIHKPLAQSGLNALLLLGDQIIKRPAILENIK